MQTAGVVELKGNLNRILSQVKGGRAVLITERGKPVARLVPEGASSAPLEKRLEQLCAAGLAIAPTRARVRKRRPLPALKGKKLSEVVVEDRR